MNPILRQFRIIQHKFRKDSRFRRRFTRSSSIIILLSTISLMFPGGRAMQFADLKEGSISTRRILAPYDFEILKTVEEYKHDQEEAALKVNQVFSLNAEQEKNSLDRINLLFDNLRDVRKQIESNPDLLSLLIDSLFFNLRVNVADSLKFELLKTSSDLTETNINKFETMISRIIQDQYTVGILDVEKTGSDVLDPKLALLVDGEETIYAYDHFFTRSEARGQAYSQMLQETNIHPDLLLLGRNLIDIFLRPNIKLNDQITQRRIQLAKSRVPRSSGLIFDQEMIIDKNERITAETRKKLDSLASKIAEKDLQEGGVQLVLPYLGRVLFVLLIICLFTVFIYLDNPEILQDNKSVILISLILLLISTITFVLRQIGASEYLIPVAMGAILLSILYDTKLGYGGAGILAVLAGALWGGEFNVMVVSFVTGVAGVVMTIKIRGRGQLVKIIFILVGAYLFISTVLGLIQMEEFPVIIKEWGFGALSGLLIPVATFGLLPLIETGFGYTTDFSLLELSNLNHPLLKQLSMTAPGTYHHSVIVGSLAEAGAQATGANSLIARVGSYYHDIGKLDKEEYFIENQMPGEKPHAKLNPSMSSLVLMNHVKRGVEVARKHKLPKAIIDTIAQHHGTTIISFFYDKALKADNGDVSEEDYRYPGPRPQSKETAIVMLADVVEAASRTLKKPTHARLQGLVNELINARFQEGQLNQSPLTLMDLEHIKEAFVKVLAGIFHARIEYPEKEVK